jgi:hypothetical protein
MLERLGHGQWNPRGAKCLFQSVKSLAHFQTDPLPPSEPGSAPVDRPESKAAVRLSAMAAVYAPSIHRATRSGWATGWVIWL